MASLSSRARMMMVSSHERARRKPVTSSPARGGGRDKVGVCPTVTF
jgi:hypothetical protein